jgi:lysozyme
MIAGLAAIAAPALSGCAGQQTPPASPDFPAAPEPVSGPSDLGLDAVIDLSHMSRVADFNAIRACGILGVLHKATEGGDWCDPLYAGRRPQGRAAGLLWGAYHFGTHQYPGAQQAAAFLAAAEADAATLTALDFEPNEANPANTMTIEQAEEFVRAVQQATGRLPLIYTHRSWADGESYGRAGLALPRPIGPDSILADCDLWLASYSDQPTLPMAWAGRGWRFWQYTGDDHSGGGPFGPLCRTVSGVDRCDRDLFQGDAGRLYQYWSGAAGPVACRC